MAVRKFMGRHQLVKRLAAQVGDESMAYALLKKRGDMTKAGKLTAKGRKRDDMTAKERAIDRSARTSGKKPGAYDYNPGTNRAVLKGKK
jgi:hypothetical protein